MRAESVALNYAEALFALGEKEDRAVAYGELFQALAEAVALSPKVQAILMSPKVAKGAKADLLAASLRGAPTPFVLFLRAVVKRGRQGLLSEIAVQYESLLDTKFNRTRAVITMVREGDTALRDAIVAALANATGKEVIADFQIDSSLLGGAVIRVGDRVLDGSLRRRMSRLRRHLLTS